MRRDDFIALRRARGMTQEELAAAAQVSTSTVARCERGETVPRPAAAARLAAALEVTAARMGELLDRRPSGLDAAAADRAWTSVLPPDAEEEVQALEVIRRVEASDVGRSTLEGVEVAVDRLCRAYGSTPPAELHGTLARHRAALLRLLDVRAGLTQRRQIMVFAGWVSLLAAVVDVDLGRRAAVAANLGAVRAIAAEAGHPELLAWAHEVTAWQAVTDGAHARAVEACRAGRAHAGDGSSVAVQLAVQEARAHARLRHARATHRLLDEAGAALGRMAAPAHPEHHFVFDARKYAGYTATTLAWLGDDDGKAEEAGRLAVAQYAGGPRDGRWARRLAAARVDLALVLARAGQPGEAAYLGTLAVDSGRLVRSNVWRVAELGLVLRGRYGALREVEDFHERLAGASIVQH